MFHKAIRIKFKKGTTLELKFQDGKTVMYDVSVLFSKYPQMEQLKDRSLFTSGRLMGGYGIIWNDELDLECESIYECGTVIKEEPPASNMDIGNAVLDARTNAEITQAELSRITGIDQGDISKIENGTANPSINTLKRIADALGVKLKVTFE